jgi:hypothetical protein
LANPGEEYLILRPTDSTDPFTVTLEAGTYTVEWFSVDDRETIGGDSVTAQGSSTVSLRAPFQPPGSALVYLVREAGS